MFLHDVWCCIHDQIGGIYGQGFAMMTNDDKQVLAVFSREIREHIPHAEVFAFGSRVNGNAEPDSDLDVCVVAPALDHDVRNAIREIAWRVSYDYGIVISTVKYTEKAFRHSALASSPLVRTIMAEGVAA